MKKISFSWLRNFNWSILTFILVLVVGCQPSSTDLSLEEVGSNLAAQAKVSTLTLSVGSIIAGRPVRVVMHGGPVGGSAGLFVSRAGTGVGACPPAAGGECMDILTPMRFLGDFTLDGTGSVSTVFSLPSAPPGTEVFFQALVVDGVDSMVSNTVTNEYVMAATDCSALGGTILVDTVITAADNPCVLADDLVVSPSVVLTIGQGVMVSAIGDYVIDVKGELVVNGSEASPVFFRSGVAAPVAGSWRGLLINDEGSGDLNWVDISHAQYGVEVEDAAFWIANSTIRSSEYGVYLYSPSTADIENTTIAGNTTGLYVSWGSADVSRSRFMANDIGLDGGSASSINLTNSTVVGNSTGIRPDGATITHNLIARNEIGIDTGTSNVSMDYNKFVANDTGIVLGGYPIRKTMNHNVFINNTDYAVVYGGGYDDGTVDATKNWWGSTSYADIEADIFDVYDDISLFQVAFTPALSHLQPSAGVIPLGVEDADGDGFYTIDTGGTDCDDTNSAIHPDAYDDVLDGIDDNCDGFVDNEVVSDTDADGFTSDYDCDDTDASVYPGADEIRLNGIDEDCNGYDLTPLGVSTVTGVLVGDVILDLANSPYVITGDIAVAPERTLVVDAGVELRFDGDFVLLNKGTLLNEGLTNDPTVYTSNMASPSMGDWQGVLFEAGSDGVIENAEISYAQVGIDADQSGLDMTGMTISNCNTGINVYGSGLSLSDSILQYNELGAYASWTSLDIDRTLIADNTTGVEGGSASSLTVTNSTIENNGVGVSPDGATLNHNDIIGNTIGIQTQLSNVYMSYNNIAENDVGVEIGGYPTRKTLNYNSFTDNTSYAVVYVGGYSEGEVDATWNWWNTADPLVIPVSIWDVFDDISLFEIVTYPYLEAAHIGTGVIPLGTDDADGDGFYSIASGGTDCDDTDSSIKPEGIDDSADSIDQDCDGVADDDVTTDADGDGYYSDVDCDDLDASVHPDAEEVAANGVDDNCNGIDLTVPTSPAGGIVLSDTILDLASSPFVFTSDLSVPPGIVLLVEAGVEIYFDGPYKLLNKGTLRVEGTLGSEALISSYAASPMAGDWEGIVTEGGGADTRLDYAIVSYADTGLSVEEAAFSVSNTEFSDCVTGINAYSPSSATVGDSAFIGNTTGVYVSWGTITVESCWFDGNTTGLEGGSASSLVISESTIENNDIGINADGATISHNLLTGNQTAIATQNSNTTMEYNIIDSNVDGITLGGYPIRKEMHYNSFTNNTGYAVIYIGGYDEGEVDATENYWGSASESDVQAAIWDFYDDAALFTVNYAGFLTSPDPLVGF
jgi:nitrous oxidase accessory protein NosD